jgi:hypothetical protein
MTAHMNGSTYTVRKKILTLLGHAFHVYDSKGDLVLYSRQKAFRLKEDIRMFTGEDMQTEVLRIQARSILDFSAAYDVVDTASNESVGALKRKGLKSLIKDEWIIMDENGRDIGLIQEDNMLLALVRRLLTNLIPQGFTASVDGQPVCEYRQNFNPFVRKIGVTVFPAADGRFDWRLGVAGAVLLCAIEGKQE